MSDLVERLRNLYVSTGVNYVQEAADEIERLTAERDALLADAARYRYLRNRTPNEVFGRSGHHAGLWIDAEDENGVLLLVTGVDADQEIDFAIDAARGA